jgi:hypothetical protein
MKCVRTRLACVVIMAIVVGFFPSWILANAQEEEPLSIAVFGNNQIDDYLNSAGFLATLVTDEDLSTEGFLTGFDAIFYTRDGSSSPGTSLSPTAAANVQEYVRSSGRGVLLNGDFADTLLGENPDTEIQQLISNATSWAAQTHHGFVGEYTGAVAGLTTNSDGLTPLAFVSGSAGQLGDGPSEGTVVKTEAGEGSPILDGVNFPLTDPTQELSFGSIVAGVDSSIVLARYSNPDQPNDGNPAIVNFSFGGTPDSAIAFCSDGCTVTTDTGAGATPSDTTVSTLIVPDEADPQMVSITETSATTRPNFCGGETCDGQLVTISDITGVTNPNDPIVLEITYDKTEAGGSRPRIYISKDGGATRKRVAKCKTPGIANPHPCRQRARTLANGDRTFTVLLLSHDPILGKK